VTPRGGSREERRLNPSAVAEWQKVVRDSVILVLATFIIVFEVAFKSSPNAYALGTALTLLGVPPALRLDSARRSKRTNGGGTAATQPATPSDEHDDDPFSGPGGYYRSR
jgi:hypothetical protein